MCGSIPANEKVDEERHVDQHVDRCHEGGARYDGPASVAARVHGTTDRLVQVGVHLVVPLRCISPHTSFPIFHECFTS